jgi:hypothetical protein
MPEIRFSLLSDGSSDQVLIPILTWALRRQIPPLVPIQSACADLRRIPNPPKELSERIEKAIQLYPCNLLFVHRDAEGQSADQRYGEIDEAIRYIQPLNPPHHVGVVPVRMMEAWLLTDEIAIRKASGNPSGCESLDIPNCRDLEHISDPKIVLREALKTACGLRGRRRQQFRVPQAIQRIPDFIEDFGLLRQLGAFRKLEEDIRSVLPRVLPAEDN